MGGGGEIGHIDPPTAAMDVPPRYLSSVSRVSSVIGVSRVGRVSRAYRPSTAVDVSPRYTCY
jgi:hypothetical protein